jgi:hypothetical protein
LPVISLSTSTFAMFPPLTKCRYGTVSRFAQSVNVKEDLNKRVMNFSTRERQQDYF